MKFKLVLIVLWLCVLQALFSCKANEDESENQPPADLTQEGWNWNLSGQGNLDIYFDERLLFSLSGVQQRTFAPHSIMLFGFFTFYKTDEAIVPLALEGDQEGIALSAKNEKAGRVFFEETEQGNLRVRVAMDQTDAGQSLRLLFSMNENDRFWGFGEQYNYIDLRGRTVPVWVQEQGVGRSAFPILPTTGSLVHSYFPMPYFLDPEQGKGFLLENTQYAEFDLGGVNRDVWSVEVWSPNEASLLLFPGPKASDVIQQLTAEVGRPKSLPPDWAYQGVWLAAQGGTDEVRETVARALDAGVPVSAVWAQDWLGQRDFGLSNMGVKYHWIHDEEHYPDLAGLIEELAGQDVRFLGYFNNFVAKRYEHWEDALEGGFIPYRPGGDPYVFPIITFTGSILDVTHPAGIDYFKGYAQKAVELGMKGWMCDFGEWLPYHARIFQGDSPSFHNLYPTAWHRINREVLEQAYPDGDFVIFTRSGYTGEQRVAQVVWAGDQEADWSEDGIGTVIKAGLTLGMSGIPFFTHDVGGFSGGPRTRELFLRWTELGAFTPFMRTHEGLQRDENHMFDSDEFTLDFFARFAQIHKDLFPYWKQLSEEAMATGLPIIRHTALVDPAWDQAYQAHNQWMLGNDMLFAPVITEGAMGVEVYFPEGTWEHFFTGQKVTGRTVEKIYAPIGQPAVFIREGTM